HARATHTHASADRVDTGIVAANRYFRAHARITGGAKDLYQALPNLRNLELEELHQKFGGRPGQEKLRPTGLRAHLFKEGFDTVLGLYLLARNHVRTRHESFRIAAEIDVNPVAIDAFHDTTDQGADPVAVGVDHLGTLGLAYF